MLIVIEGLNDITDPSWEQVGEFGVEKESHGVVENGKKIIIHNERNELRDFRLGLSQRNVTVSTINHTIGNGVFNGVDKPLIGEDIGCCMNRSRGCLHRSRGCLHRSRGCIHRSGGCLHRSRGCLHRSRSRRHRGSRFFSLVRITDGTIGQLKSANESSDSIKTIDNGLGRTGLIRDTQDGTLQDSPSGGVTIQSDTSLIDSLMVVIVSSELRQQLSGLYEIRTFFVIIEGLNHVIDPTRE
jgi:hypothetical protein